VQRLFGIPVDSLAIALALALGVVGAVVAVLALRHRILLRLALRNLLRRPGRAALIVTGLMLGTTIICSALVTGDTMSRTVRGSVIETLGNTDELVAVRGADRDQPEFFPESRFAAVDRALRATGDVDGTAPAIVLPVAVQDMRSRQTEARVSLFAPDPTALAGFGRLNLGALGPEEVYLDRDAKSDDLGTLFIPNSLGIVKGCPHPEAARKLIDHLLSDEVEARLAEGESAQIPLGSRVATKVRVETPATVKAMPVDFAAAAKKWDEAHSFLRETFGAQ